MQKSSRQKQNLRIASDNKTPYEIYSIILKGVLSSLKSIFMSYYVSENIEALMSYINERKIISAAEYKSLLSEAKDFYAVIICALFVNPIKKATKNFKLVELKEEDKEKLFEELQKELNDFFADWLCDVEINPMLLYRLALSYNKSFNLDLSIKAQSMYNMTELESLTLKLQIIDIISLYMIEEVAVHLGLAGLDYIDFYKAPVRSADKNIPAGLNNCIDTI